MAASEGNWAQAQPHSPTPQQSAWPGGALPLGSSVAGGAWWWDIDAWSWQPECVLAAAAGVALDAASDATVIVAAAREPPMALSTSATLRTTRNRIAARDMRTI